MEVLESCLQNLGIQQSKSNYVIESVKICLDQAVKNSTSSKDTCDDFNTKASRPYDEHEESIYGSAHEAKTMMVCNIPCRASRADLVEALDSVGFGGLYEFVHVPCRFGQSDSNLGYGFVHFFQKADADRFAIEFEGYRFIQKGSTKACTVKLANCQGRNGSKRRVARNLRQAQRKSPE
jgi:hypothetical protein